MKKTIGRVVGPLGALFVLFALLSRLFITGEFNAYVWIQLGLGIAGLVVWVTTAFDDVRNIATGRGTMFVVTSAVATLVLTAGLGAANYWAKAQEVEWDFTAAGVHTLAEQTQDLLKKLDEKTKVKVTAFYANGEPGRDALEALLRRYKLIGGDNFEYEFVDVRNNPQIAKAMNVNQASPRIVVKNAAGREARVKEIGEEPLTNGLAELGRGAAKKIYFLTGHGEKTIGKGGDTAIGLKMWNDWLVGEGFATEELSLLTNKDVPADAGALVIAGPQAPVDQGERDAIDAYAKKGGRVVVMLDPGVETGLEALVAGWGAEMMPGAIIDTATRNPLFAVSQEFSEHPIAVPKMSALGALPFVLPDARGVKATIVKGYTSTELFKTGERSWSETSPLDPTGQVPPAFEETTDVRGPVPMAVAITKKDGEQEFRAVVVGDSDFVSNQFVRQNGNRDLSLNVIQWTVGSEERITIRPKLRAKSTIASLTDDKLVLLSFGSLNLLPLLLIGLGLSVWSVRKSK